MFPIRVPKGFRIIAHRGASAYAPENTLPAFQLAKTMSVTEVELDTQLSSDGVVVLCHDDTLERYGHGGAPVEDRLSTELGSLDMGSWFSPYQFANTPMLMLDQLLTAFSSDFIYHIELKGRAVGLTPAVYSVVEGQGLLARSIFTSFSLQQLARMRKVSSTCRLGWLVEDFDGQTLDHAARLDLFQLCPKADRVCAELVERGNSVVPEIRPWGMNGQPQEVQQLLVRAIDSGCDGVTINWPDWAVH